MTKLLFSLSIAFLGAVACAQAQTVETEETTDIPTDPSFTPQVIKELFPDIKPQKFTAKIRVLNKRSSQISRYTLKPETVIIHEGLDISLKHCLHNYNGEAGNDVAWVDAKTSEGVPVFSGWIYKRFPGASGLQHPLYMIHLEQCSN